MFERVAVNLGKSHIQQRPLNRAGRPYGKAQYHLASFEENFETKSLPLGYRWNFGHPNPNLDCDSPACRPQQRETEIRRLTCGHSFHDTCMRDSQGNNLGCFLCLPNLTRDIQKLCHSWNLGLLSTQPGDAFPGEDDDSDDGGGDDDSKLDKPLKSEKDHKYFESREFHVFVEGKVASMMAAIAASKKRV